MTAPRNNSLTVQPRLQPVLYGTGPIEPTRSGRLYTISYNPGAVVTGAMPSGGQILAYDPVAATNIRVASTALTGVPYTGLTAIPAAIDAIDGLTPAADKIAYYTGAATATLADITSTGRTLLASASALAVRTAIDVPQTTRTIATGSGLSGGGDLSADRTISWDGVQARKNSAGSTLTRRRINFIEGSGISLTVSDDAVDGELDLTVTNTASSSAPVGVITNLGLSASPSAGALTVSITTAGGSTPSGGDPVSLPFRSATTGTGTVTQRNLTAANSITIPSGATFGFVSGVIGHRIWVLGIDDGGTIRSGLVNVRSGTSIMPLPPSGIISSLLISGSANSAQVVYTDGAAVTNKPYVVLGYLEWPSAFTTAGTWTWTATDIARPWAPGLKLPGDVVQIVPARYTSNTTLTANIPIDDTIPQVTEGTEILSAALTPTSAANILTYRFFGAAAPSTGAFCIAAAFLNGGSNAIGATEVYQATAGGQASLVLENEYLAGGTSAQTITIRAGASTGNLAFNGAVGARYLGGTQSARLVISEVIA